MHLLPPALGVFSIVIQRGGSAQASTATFLCARAAVLRAAAVPLSFAKPAAVRCGVGKPAAGMLYSLQRAVRALGNESRFTQHFLLRASVSTVTAKFSMPMCEIVRTLLCCQLFLRLYQIPQNHI